MVLEIWTKYDDVDDNVDNDIHNYDDVDNGVWKKL